MSRVPNEYRIVLWVIFLIAVPSAVLCYLSIYAMGREEQRLAKRLKSTYEGAVEKTVRLTHRSLRDEEERVKALAEQLHRRSFTLQAAWNLLSDTPEESATLGSLYLFDGEGRPHFPPLGPDGDRPAATAGSSNPAVLKDLRDRLRTGHNLEFGQAAYVDAQEAYRVLAEEAGRRTGGPALDVAAESLLGMARCHRKRGNAARAVELLDTVVYRYPAAVGTAGVPLTPGALLEKARICQSLGDNGGAHKACLELAAFLARNESVLPARYLPMFRAQLIELGGTAVHARYLSTRARVAAYRSFMDAFGPQARKAAAAWNGRTEASHLYAGERLAYAVYLTSLPEGPGLKGLAVFEVDLPRLRDVFEESAANAGVEGRVSLLSPSGSQESARDGLVPAYPFPKPLHGWEVRLRGEGRDQLSGLSRWRWSLFFWIILIASAVLVGGILFVIRRVSREVKVARDRSTFLSNVTHELKTPLTSIRMFIDTLQMGRVQDPAEVEECLGVMANETDRLTKLIERVLDFSKAERGTKRYDFRRVRVEEIIDRTLAIFQNQMKEDECELTTQVAEDVPEVRADPDAVIEVLLNVLDNALKYSPDEKKIALRVAPRDGKVALSVLDRGVGIASKDLDRIFTPFYRVEDGSSSAVEGTGLGLAHSRRVMRDHGGDILVESELNLGSIFTILIPRWKE